MVASTLMHPQSGVSVITRTITLFFLLLIFLSGCSPELPEPMPDVGINQEELAYNTSIKISAPKQLNTYKSGESVDLEIVNLTQNEWIFNVTKDILIYQYEQKEWKKISDKMINIGATELVLGAKGIFPLDNIGIGVLPDLKIDQSSRLRIIVIVHGKNAGFTLCPV
jgi:hypothetical protein